MLYQASDKKLNHYLELWSTVQRDLLRQYGDKVFTSWFSKINFTDYQNNRIVLSTPTKFIRDWINNNYFDFITQLWKHYDPSIQIIDLIADENAVYEPKSPNLSINDLTRNTTASSNDTTPINKSTFLNSLPSDNIFISNLDARFTFEHFVVGTPNELAYAASRAISEAKEAIPESNPLFLYGGVGLGKTHLMHAIAWHIKRNNPQRKFIYMSAERFMYQFVCALRNKNVLSFKEQFRSVDVLMIDDIQFICGKDSTQEEFFHTFNTLIDNHRQMIISCDRSPSDLDNIEERIKSRLGWGLVADVHSTTYELRLGILQSKVEQMNIYVPAEVLEFLASKVTSNVRELEGALNKVIAHSTLVGRPITLSNTQEILRDLLKSNEKAVTIEDIQKKVAERYNIKISDMSSARRTRTVSRPRQLAMYLAKLLTPKSLADIGKKFGNKDHTTVIHAIKKVEELCKCDAEFSEEVNLMTKIIQN